jgi:hypothetical protein
MDAERDNEFRFATKKEYEDEMKRLIVSKNSKRKRDVSLEEQYEELVEEYLKFCTAQEEDA